MNMTKSIEIRELNVSDLELVSGGDLITTAIALGVAGNLAYDIIKGEANGEGFVAQAVKTATGHKPS